MSSVIDSIERAQLRRVPQFQAGDRVRVHFQVIEGTRRRTQVFEGVVTGSSDKGTWARVFQPPVEGKVVQGSEGLQVGDRLRVKLIGTDVERGFIDFVRAN